MLIRPTEDIIEAVTGSLELGPAFIEKDFYVTQVLHGMNQLKNDDFELIFIGGTCLTKAHQVVQRMSEDVDFKLVPRESLSLNSRIAREQLSNVRHQIMDLIQETTGLSPKEGQLTKGNNNRFTQIFLDYNAFYPAHDLLRPQIKIELTAQSMLLPAESLEVSSLIHRTLSNNEITQSQMMLCTSIQETASEKWAALCRRVADAERDQHNPEKSIIRHLYDLCCIEKKKGISADFEQLTPIIILRDRERFKGKSPHFYENPLEEIQKGFHSLRDNRHWENNYKEFVENMVFQKEPPTFSEAIQALERIQQRAINAIQKSEIFQNSKTISIGTTEEDKKKIVSSSLREKLLDYANAQKKQQQLLWAYYEVRSTDDRSETMKAKETVATHFSELNSRSLELYNDPEIKTLIKSMQHVESPNEAVSWVNVKAQLLNDQEAHQAISVLLPPIKRAGFQANLALSQHQSQHKGGGRKR